MKRLLRFALMVACLLLIGCGGEQESAINGDATDDNQPADTVTPGLGDTLTPDVVDASTQTDAAANLDSVAADTSLDAGNWNSADVPPATVPECEPNKLRQIKIAAAKERLALCNNGEPAVFYIRWGSTSAPNWTRAARQKPPTNRGRA